MSSIDIFLGDPNDSGDDCGICGMYFFDHLVCGFHLCCNISPSVAAAFKWTQAEDGSPCLNVSWYGCSWRCLYKMFPTTSALVFIELSQIPDFMSRQGILHVWFQEMPLIIIMLCKDGCSRFKPYVKMCGSKSWAWLVKSGIQDLSNCYCKLETWACIVGKKRRGLLVRSKKVMSALDGCWGLYDFFPVWPWPWSLFLVISP